MPEITQEELDSFKAKEAKATELETKLTAKEKELEDTRMEVLSPEYTAFLESYEKDKNKDKDKDKDKNKSNDDDLSKLSPAQILERAKKEALEEMRSEQSKKEKETAAQTAARTKREISEFAKEHDDFEQYRPIMYGLSLDPKNSDLKLADLYEKAKGHVKSLKTGASEADKEKQRKMNNEKPGSDAASLKKLKETSNTEIGREALEEVKKEFGPIPAA